MKLLSAEEVRNITEENIRSNILDQVMVKIINAVKSGQLIGMIDINDLIKNATLSKDKVALNAYKNIKAEFQKVKTAKNYKGEWNDKLEMQIISKYGRSLEDAIQQFSQAHRDDLVTEYINELEVVKKLLPEPVNESEIHSELCQWAESKNYGYILSTNNPVKIPKKEMGNAIKHLKSKFPTADGKIISKIVKKYVI